MFTGYVNTITEKMGYDGTPKNIASALSPTASKTKNAGKVLKQYMKSNVSEGLEEVYATLFERMGDVISGVGYVDENGKIQQRKLVGDEGVIDAKALGESFLGDTVGGAVMGGAGVISNILNTDAKSVREYGNAVKQEIDKTADKVIQKARELGVETPKMPKEINWKTASVVEINDYLDEVNKVYSNILSNEKVINHDKAAVDNFVNKLNSVETKENTVENTLNTVKNTEKTVNQAENTVNTLNTVNDVAYVAVTKPITDNVSVSVGDTFKDTKNGNIITVTKRNDNNSTIEINSGATTDTREVFNSQANRLITSKEFERIDNDITTQAEAKNITLTRMGDFL